MNQWVITGCILVSAFMGLIIKDCKNEYSLESQFDFAIEPISIIHGILFGIAEMAAANSPQRKPLLRGLGRTVEYCHRWDCCRNHCTSSYAFMSAPD